mgnify:CR=1 FL=1
MKERIKIQMEESIRNFRMPRYEELPDGGLYLEQTAQYMNQILKPLGCVSITSSMISNYVKKGLIQGPVKKRYYAEQIAYLFYIVIAKHVLTLEHILLLKELQEQSYTKEVAYNYFCEELENVLFVTFGIKKKVDKIGNTVSYEKIMFRDVIIAVANCIFLTNCFNLIQEERDKYNE